MKPNIEQIVYVVLVELKYGTRIPTTRTETPHLNHVRCVVPKLAFLPQTSKQGEKQSSTIACTTNWERWNKSMGASMDACMDASMDAWMHERMHAWIHAWMHEYMHAWMHAWMHGCMHGCMHE